MSGGLAVRAIKCTVTFLTGGESMIGRIGAALREFSHRLVERWTSIVDKLAKVPAHFKKHYHGYEVLGLFVVIGLSLWSTIINRNASNKQTQAAIDAARMSRGDAYMQTQAALLNELKKEFDSLQKPRHEACEFALKHLAKANGAPVPLDQTPAGVWQVMDFFDKLSRTYVEIMSTKRWHSLASITG
jgi:hypothetical protein